MHRDACLQTYVSGGGAVADVGLSLGYAIRLTDTLSLMPEYTAVMPLPGMNLFYTEFKVGLIVGPLDLTKSRDGQP